MQYCFTKGLVDQWEVAIEFLGTHDMVADFPTKSLKEKLFLNFRNYILREIMQFEIFD